MRPLLLLLLTAACYAQPRLPLSFDKDPGWQPRPGFLSNAAGKPDIAAVEGGIMLKVSEPGKGMKFELPLKPFDSGASAYLVLRYRAANLAGGYAIWAFDGSPDGKQILGVEELIRDDQWHTVALDMFQRGVLGSVRSLVTEVECADKPAAMTFGTLGLSDEPPAGAAVIPQPAKDDELILRPADLKLEAHKDWLATPASKFGAERQSALLHLFAEGAEKGMKWSASLPQTVDLSKYRYAVIRYRALGTTAWGDYFVWLGSEHSGMPAQSAQLMPLSGARADGSWQVAVVPIKETFKAVHLALEVGCVGDRAEAWLDTIRFTTRRPLVDIADVLPISPGWAGAKLSEGSFKAVDLSAQADGRAQSRLRGLALKSWFPGGKVTVRGIPFHTAEGEKNVVLSPEDIDRQASVTVGAAGSEAYLLLAAKLPATDAARMGDPAPMDHFTNPERLVCRVEYADGVTDEIFPINVGAGRYEVRRGVEVYCLSGLRSAPVQRIALRNRMDSASLMLAGVTLNQGKPVTPEPEVTGLPGPTAPGKATEAGPGKITATADGFLIENGLARLTLKTTGGISVQAIENRCLNGAAMTVEAGPLFEIGVRAPDKSVGRTGTPDTLVGQTDTLLTSEQVSVGKPQVATEGPKATLTVPVDATPGGVPVRGDLVVTVGEGDDIGLRLNLAYAGAKVGTPIVSFPLIHGMKIGKLEDTWYLWARKGGVVNNRLTDIWGAYGGEYPLQVADVFGPNAGGGLALLTYDLADIARFWHMTKDAAGVTWRMDYLAYEHQPGEKIETAPTALRAHGGDWREALRIYTDWAHSWYKPQVARKQWFQECFYYQQTWAWGNLRDPKTGKWRMDEVIKQYRDYFGRLDYLHVFDFGESKVFGRVGDYNHYEELGGREKMRAAIQQAQDMGVPVGLYLEGYLCDERCAWGRANVERNEIKNKDGTAMLWEPKSPEHVMCSAAEGWRKHLAGCYAQAAQDLKPSGLYIDEYGFLGAWRTCWSRQHGHPVPWPPNRGERDTTRAIRDATPPEIATLTEETPNDVNSQYQDGALGYSVTWTDPELSPHRIDLMRFAFPSFKVFQLTCYNPFMEGGWDLLKWPFFNGEGYWLHGSTDFYCEDAHQFLRKAFAILHEYRDAFCSDDVAPLVPTLKPTVYANRFRGPERTVWTLFNADFRTFRGDCLRVAHKPGAKYMDAFSGKELATRVEGDMATMAVELGPRDVGCVVEER